MDSKSIQNKRIAKNTVLLYFRMIFILCISFYTTRAILQALGVVDLGIYNVVGGVVAMFGFINGSLSSATSRFITFALGQNNEKELKSIFNTIITIHILFAIVILVLAETIGLWFVMHKLVIPENRMFAALCVYQSAVVSSSLLIISTPFNADIIAHEKMSAFAYISIFEALAKLGIVFILFSSFWDKLITYSFLLVIVQGIIVTLYVVYCKKHFFESHWSWMWEKERVKSMFSYAGWVMTGSFAFIVNTQGLNILLNMFFGPAVNAARALAIQLQGALNQFTTNFQTAVKPQITKSYAQNDMQRMHNLVIVSSKFGPFLMLLLLVPLVIETKFLLGIWLKQIPEHTVNFVRIMLFVGLISAMKDPTLAAVHATGKIKRAQLIETICMLSLIPIAFLLQKAFQISAEVTLTVYLVVEIITQFARVWVIYPQVGLKKRVFINRIFLPLIIVLGISLGTSFLIKNLLPESLLFNIIMIIISECITIFSIYGFGLTKSERIIVNVKILGIIKKLTTHCNTIA